MKKAKIGDVYKGKTLVVETTQFRVMKPATTQELEVYYKKVDVFGNEFYELQRTVAAYMPEGQLLLELAGVEA